MLYIRVVDFTDGDYLFNFSYNYLYFLNVFLIKYKN